MNTLSFVPDENYPSGKVGWLCVRNADSSYSEPFQYVHYWPIAHGGIKDFEETFPELNTDAQLHGDCSFGSGGYSFYRGIGAYSPVLRLIDGGQTKAVKFEKVAIPCPRVRGGIETRYWNGRWEKYLKAQGWVAA
jgi:hypothetical protein